VAVKRSLGNIQPLGERRGRDALPLGGLEHLGERLEDLEPAFAFCARHD
jgi:hypothetical protein